jgi:FkbM family methyltransferase
MIKRDVQNVLKLAYKTVGGRPIFARIPFLSKSFRSIARRAFVDDEGVSLSKIQGHKMHIPVDDSFYQYTLNDYQAVTTDVFMNALHPGDVAFDVGAHIGYYTLLAARQVGENGRIFAFEPDPNNYEVLVKNVNLNNYRNVIPIKKAVTNKTGTTKLFLKSSSSHSLFYDSTPESGRSIDVESVSLDDFFNKWPKSLTSRIRLIKMDIEGAEMLALLGMSQLIKELSLTIITEITPTISRSGFEPEEYISKLLDYGFEVRGIGVEAYSTSEIIDTMKRMRCLDLLCSKSSKKLA